MASPMKIALTGGATGIGAEVAKKLKAAGHDVAAFGDKMAANVARAGHPGLASKIAGIIIFMASPTRAWIKGQDICVDGGMGAMAMAGAIGLPK